MADHNRFNIRDLEGNRFTILADTVFSNRTNCVRNIHLSSDNEISIGFDKIVAIHWDEDGAAWVQDKCYYKKPVLSLYVSDGKLLTAEQIELAKESVMEFVGGII